MSEPRTPEVGEYVRGQGRLVAVVDADPPPIPSPTQDYIFEEITARTELRHNGDVIKDIQTVWDAYGLETSVETSIKEAMSYSKQRNIGPSSELEVVVVRIASQVRKREARRENFYDKAFRSFEPLPVGSNWNVGEDKETVVWSSKNPADR